MAITWALKRRVLYGTVVIGVLLLLVIVPLWFIFNTKATCSDGVQNGTETGVDCGGACSLLCNASLREPQVLWARSLPVTDTVYSAIAFVENRNYGAEAFSAMYTFTGYDSRGAVVFTHTGNTYIPPRSSFPVFAGGIRLSGNKQPVRTTFEFTKKIEWHEISEDTKNAYSTLSIFNEKLSDPFGSPRLSARISNASPHPFSDVLVIALLKDKEGTVVGASQTIVDTIPADSFSDVVFTWPHPFDVPQGICSVPVDMALIMDYSGSMDDDGGNPPEPLASVKEAAKDFIGSLNDTDRVSFIAFDREAHVVRTLSSNHEGVIDAIQKLSINETSSGYTNIGDGIYRAFDELKNNVRSDSAKEISILITDGVPTWPINETDEQYPYDYALLASQNARLGGMGLYVIGLGDAVDSVFLKSLVDEDHYFSAERQNQLLHIYRTIATSVCDTAPSVIEIIPLPRY